MSSLVKFELPASFISECGLPTAPELGYGFAQGWLSRGGVVAVALAKYEAGVALVPEEEELALLLSDELDRVRGLADRLELFDEPVERRARYWLYVALAWVQENKSDYVDPLQVVEMLWADFEYPPEIRGFIRFMPVERGLSPGVDKIERRWSDYVARTRAEYLARDLGRR